jgi:serine/threonine-protein kinase HipA
MKHVTELRVSFAGEPVGILALHNRQYWFQYDPHWLQNGFNLAPQTMNFDNNPQLAKSPLFHGLHGVFYDSLPDGWGLLLMDRFFKRELGWEAHEITPLDRLAYLGQRAMGALEYEPALSNDIISESVNLSELLKDAEQIIAGKSRAVLNQLRILGGSPGGARPKVSIALSSHSDNCVAGMKKLPEGFSHWLVKFRGTEDPNDMGRIEKTYAELAAHAGLEVAPNRLISVTRADKKNEILFATKRFDRVENTKLHLLTLSGYLYADHRLPALDYSALLAATAILTKDLNYVRQMFRLMIFNVAMHNKDDHAKNFAFICSRDGRFHLAPAYDLTFSAGMNNEHTTAIQGKGNPGRQDLEAIAAAHGIHNWEKIVDEVFKATSRWPVIAEKNHVTKSSIKKIGMALMAIRKKLK